MAFFITCQDRQTQVAADGMAIGTWCVIGTFPKSVVRNGKRNDSRVHKTHCSWHFEINNLYAHRLLGYERNNRAAY